MKAYPIVGIPRLSEAQEYLESRIGEPLSLLNLFRLAHAGELQLVLFMNDAASDSFYYCPEVDSDFYSEEVGYYSKSMFRQGYVLANDENEEFFMAVEDELVIDDGLTDNELAIKWLGQDRPLDSDHYYLPLTVVADDLTFVRMRYSEELSAKRSLELGCFEGRFGVTSESLNQLISKCKVSESSNGVEPNRSARLSTQGENAYRRSCRALAQALVGTLPDSPSIADIRNIERELAERGVKNPHSQKTWQKHLSQPD